MSNNDDFREDLITLLVNGMSLDFMNLTDALDVIDFADDLKNHYMKDSRLVHLFFWTDNNVILHEEKGLESSFAVVVTGEILVFRTADGTIDNHKNAGRILMSTIAFIHTKLEELGLVEAHKENEIPQNKIEIVEEIINKYDKKVPEDKEDDSSEDSSSDPDFEWI